MKILLLGFTSTVGYRFWEKYSNEYNLMSTYRNDLPNDLAETNDSLIKTNYTPEELSSIICNEKPDLVINTVGLTSPDYCEESKPACKSVNLDLVKSIADSCKKHNSKLVHFSTHAVYDGSLDIYNENAKHSPINYYGYCKSEADIYIHNNLNDFLILRPTAIVSKKRDFQRGNILDFIIQNITNGHELNLIDTDCVNYTYLEDLVDILHLAIQSKLTGEFNIGGEEALTKFDLGTMVSGSLNLKANIKKVSLESLNLPAKRAASTILDNNRIKANLNFKFTSLAEAIKQIHQSQKDR